LHEGRVYFGQPSLLYLPIQTSASVYYREERNPETTLTGAFNVDRLGAVLQQERQLSHSYVWSYGYRFERARKFAVTADGAQDETVTVSPLTTTFLREGRDDILDASTGSFTSHAFSYSPSWLGASTSYVRYYGQYFRYIPLAPPTRKRFTNEILRPRFVYAVGARLGLAWSPTSVPDTERFHAGGSTTLRGFEQNSVGPIDEDGIPSGGQALLVINNEIRAPLVGIVDGVAFLDIGAVSGRVRDLSFRDLRKTAGVGLRVRTPWFLIRGDYGIVLDRRPGERRGRFYFSIGQAF
jgi:outer membrane protein insertion porin family